MKYKDTINESNKDKARITLKENNNQENGSKYSENNTNEETKEESKTINWRTNENKYNNSDTQFSLLLYESEINVDNFDKERNM